jgi:hypothetical protein
VRSLGRGLLHWFAREQHRRRLRRLIFGVAFAVLGLAAGLGAGQPFASRPVGQATVLVNPLPGNAFSVRSISAATLVDLKTEAQLAFSDAVLSKIRSETGGDIDEAVLRRRISVRVVNDAEVIVISYRGDTSRGATRMAARIAESFLKIRTANAVTAANSRTAIVEASLVKTQHDFDVAAKSEQDPEAVTVLGQRITALRGDLRAVGGVPPSSGSVLAASAPRSAEVRKVRVSLLVACVVLSGLVGLVLGRRARHLPRWTRRLRIRRRFFLRTPQQARPG